MKIYEYSIVESWQLQRNVRKAVPEFTARMHDGMFKAQHKGEDVDFGVWAKNQDGSEDWGLTFSAMHQGGIFSNCFCLHSI